MPPILTNAPAITPVAAPTTISRISPAATASSSSSSAAAGSRVTSTTPSAPTLNSNYPLILNSIFPAPSATTNRDNKINIDKAQLNPNTSSSSSYYRGSHYLPPNEGDGDSNVVRDRSTDINNNTNTNTNNNNNNNNQYKFIPAPVNVSSPASQVLSLKEYMRQHGVGKHATSTDTTTKIPASTKTTTTNTTNSNNSNSTAATAANSNREDHRPSTKNISDDKSHIRNRVNLETSNYNNREKENTTTSNTTTTNNNSSNTNKIDDYLQNYKKNRSIDQSTRAPSTTNNNNDDDNDYNNSNSIDYKFSNKYSKELENNNHHNKISNYLDEKNTTLALDHEFSMTGTLAIEDYNVLEREVEAAAVDSRKKVAAAAANLDREMAELLQSYIRVTNDQETDSTDNIPTASSSLYSSSSPLVIKDQAHTRRNRMLDD